MKRPTVSLDAAYFERLYRRDPDPWRFRTSPYERDKYAATLAALSRPRYASALEVGCANGTFTRLLAPRCERLLALDASDAALEHARRHCADLGQVAFRRATLPAQFPDGRFDLILLCEVLYYLAPDDLAELAARCLATLAPGGEILLCHWLGETDYPQTGDAAAEGFIAAAVPPLRFRVRRREAAYRLEVLGA